MDEQHMTASTEKEKSAEKTGVFIGRLGDLGLGNPEGIPSAYAEASDEELNELAQSQVERLVPVADETALACIDGRHTNRNADGSPATARLRRVGGSAANFGTALNSNSSVLDTFSGDDTFGHRIHLADEFVENATGYERSAHLGGCGGAKGEVKHQRLIAQNPAIMGTVRAIMDIPDVAEYFGVHFDSDLAELVRANAEKTADYLEANSWSGDQYVAGVEEDNARGVEDLEVDHDDHSFHGHKENTLTIIIGDETLDGDDDFVWNLKASMEVAKALSVGRGKDGYIQALIAELAKHAAVADDLPGPGTPVILVKSAYTLAA